MSKIKNYRAASLIVLALACSATVSSRENPGNLQFGDFNADRVSGVSVDICEQHGGRMGHTPSGQACELGPVMAVFHCDNGVMVSLLYRSEDSTVFHWSGSHVEHAELRTGVGGARWIGKRLQLWERGSVAKVVARNWKSRCKKLHSM